MTGRISRWMFIRFRVLLLILSIITLLFSGCVSIPGGRGSVSILIYPLEGEEEEFGGFLRNAIVLNMMGSGLDFMPIETEEKTRVQIFESYLPADVAEHIDVEQYRKLFFAQQNAKRLVYVSVPRELVKELPIFKTHEDAKRLGIYYTGAALVVLWGKYVEFGGKRIVIWQISVPDLDSVLDDEIGSWQLAFNRYGRSFSFEVEIPERYIALPPVTLQSSFVESFANEPRFPIYSDPDGVERKDYDISFEDKIESSGIRVKGLLSIKVPDFDEDGWVRIPEIFSVKTPALDAMKGVADALAGRPSNAEISLTRVIINETSPATLVRTAYLFRAFAKEKSGVNAREDILKAMDMGPISKRSIQMLVMSYLAELSQLPEAAEERSRERELLGEISLALERYELSYPEGDSWFVSTRHQVKGLQEAR